MYPLCVSLYLISTSKCKRIVLTVGHWFIFIQSCPQGLQVDLARVNPLHCVSNKSRWEICLNYDCKRLSGSTWYAYHLCFTLSFLWASRQTCSFLLGKCKFEICYLRSDFTFLLISMNNNWSSFFFKEVIYLFIKKI